MYIKYKYGGNCKPYGKHFWMKDIAYKEIQRNKCEEQRATINYMCLFQDVRSNSSNERSFFNTCVRTEIINLTNWKMIEGQPYKTWETEFHLVSAGLEWRGMATQELTGFNRKIGGLQGKSLSSLSVHLINFAN